MVGRGLGWIIPIAMLVVNPGASTLHAQPSHFGVRTPAVAPSPIPAPGGSATLSLEQARQLVLANNKELNLARLNIQEKLFATSAARRDYLPKLLSNVDYFHFNTGLGSVQTVRTGRLGILPPGARTLAVNVLNQDSTLVGITLAQPITKLIMVNAAVQVAKADQAIARAQHDKGTRDLLTGVTQVYQSLYGAQRIQAALAMQVDYAEKLALADPKPEVRAASIEARQALLQVRNQTTELTEQFNGLLNFPPGTVLNLVEPLPPAPPVGSPEEAVQLALLCNPQVREAQANVEKAGGARKIARADFLPDVNVFGSYFNQSLTDSIQSNFGAFGVSASYTFVDWGKRRQVAHQRDTQVAMAMEQVRVTIDKVTQEARKAYFGFVQAQEALGLAVALAQTRKEAEQALDKADPAAIAAAKAASAKAELEAMQAELGYRVAHAELLGTIGRP